MPCLQPQKNSFVGQELLDQARAISNDNITLSVSLKELYGQYPSAHEARKRAWARLSERKQFIPTALKRSNSNLRSAYRSVTHVIGFRLRPNRNLKLARLIPPVVYPLIKFLRCFPFSFNARVSSFSFHHTDAFCKFGFVLPGKYPGKFQTVLEAIRNYPFVFASSRIHLSTAFLSAKVQTWNSLCGGSGAETDGQAVGVDLSLPRFFGHDKYDWGTPEWIFETAQSLGDR